MAFKLRSGNKTNFKNMGSSPVKQDNNDDGLVSKGETEADLALERMKSEKLQSQIDELKSGKDVPSERNKRILEGKGTDEDYAKQKLAQQSRADAADKVPWSQKVKDKHKYRDASSKNVKSDRWEENEKGEMVYRDEDTDLTRAEKIVKNRQAREKDRKAYEAAKKGGASKEDLRKLKKQQRYNRKTDRMYRNYEDAQAKGTQGLRFNWKNMFLGGLSDAFDVDSKKDILADRMKKRYAKTKTRKKVKDAKSKLAKDKYERTGKVAIGTQIANIFRPDAKDKKYRGEKK